jgi:hypothetical protein
MPKCLLTPTQKAKYTKTFFIRVQLWTPEGNRIEMEMPWVSKREGGQLLKRMTLICGATHEGRTNEDWEALAMEGLARDKKARAK